jgi:lysophospholipase L1-like esterase
LKDSNFRQKTVRNLLFAAMALLLFFGSVELCLRLARLDNPLGDAPIIVRDITPTESNYRGLFISTPDMLWELNPGAKFRFTLFKFSNTGGKRRDVFEERINGEGFRGPAVPLRKPEKTMRILLLGDSSVFGLGVPLKYTFAEQLRASINAPLRRSGYSADVINGGVIGYTSAQGFQLLKKKFAPYSPDVVVIMFGAVNESLKRDTLSDRETIAFLTKHRGMNVFVRSLMKLRISRLLYVTAEKVRGQDQAPERRYRARVSPAEFRKDLDAFFDASCNDNFSLVAISPPRKRKLEASNPGLLKYNDAVQAFAAKNEVVFVDAHKYFSLHEDKVFFRYDEVHPNAVGHTVIAEMLVPAILRSTMNDKAACRNR